MNRAGFTVYGVHPAFLLSDARFSAIYRVSRRGKWDGAKRQTTNRNGPDGGVLGRSWNSLPPESVHTQPSGGGRGMYMARMGYCGKPRNQPSQVILSKTGV